MSKFSFRSRLIVLMILPLAGLVYFGASTVRSTWRQVVSLEEVRRQTESAVRASAAVHELQKERGLSAGYLSSKGVRFAAELNGQRNETDRRLKELDRGEARGAWREVTDRLGELAQTRARINSQSVDGKESFNYCFSAPNETRINT